MTIQKCYVKITDNKVVCNTNDKVGTQPTAELQIKNKQKLNHLTGIGMDLTKYHPSILRTMIDGGRNVIKIPDHLKRQLIDFAKEAHDKGFNPSLFGYNTTLHKFIKSVNEIPKRPYIKKHVRFNKGGLVNPSNIVLEVKEAPSNSICSRDRASSSSESSSESSSSESETDLDGILSDVEADIKGGKISAVKKKLKKYKHRIPPTYYKKIMEGL